VKQIAYFRKSTKKLEIHDAEEKRAFWQKLKNFFSRKRQKKEYSEKPQEGGPSEIKIPYLLKGEYLKGVRKIRGISIEEMAMATKMSVARLKALEEEDFSRFPKGANVPSLLKLYASCLGLQFKENSEKE
jgi:hypothetical protein